MSLRARASFVTGLSGKHERADELTPAEEEGVSETRFPRSLRIRESATRRTGTPRFDRGSSRPYRTYHDARVDVPERAQAEQIGSMLRVVEAIGGGLINRKRARVGGGIGHLARVHLQGLEFELVTGHDGNDGDVERRETSRKGVGAEVRCAL